MPSVSKAQQPVIPTARHTISAPLSALGDEVLHGWRQQLRLVDVPGAKGLAHDAKQNLTCDSLASKTSLLSGLLFGHAPRTTRLLTPWRYNGWCFVCQCSRKIVANTVAFRRAHVRDSFATKITIECFEIILLFDRCLLPLFPRGRI
jgi:hypothetical protein